MPVPIDDVRVWGFVAGALAILIVRVGVILTRWLARRLRVEDDSWELRVWRGRRRLSAHSLDQPHGADRDREAHEDEQ